MSNIDIMFIGAIAILVVVGVLFIKQIIFKG